jgi:DNA-directed RNA polymerase subunit RPC12/RpoP
MSTTTATAGSGARTAVGIVKVDAYKCERCGHIWLPREPNKNRKPILCAKCKSAYWDIPRPKVSKK